MTNKFIILDRDGVINYDSPFYIKNPDEWHAIPGSLNAIADLNRAGFHVLVVTNQSGVGRGFYDLEMLDRIHEKLVQELAEVGGYIDEIFFCPHHPDDNCPCRKPKLELFYRIQKKYGLQFSDTFYIGDSYSDVQAAFTSGCKPILVLTSKGQQTLDDHPECLTIPHFLNLAEAVKNILGASSNYF
jgi:D-glycero-D-manno-heptose 1,7-bisphosphate phosphatase